MEKTPSVNDRMRGLHTSEYAQAEPQTDREKVVMEILSGDWESGELVLTGMPKGFILSKRKVVVSELESGPKPIIEGECPACGEMLKIYEIGYTPCSCGECQVELGMIWSEL